VADEYSNFNQKIIDEFRDGAGKVGGPFEGAPMLLLHHKGAKTGTERVSPVVYLADDGRYVVFASKGGAPENPSWYHNLLANPSTSIEVGTGTINVTAREAEGDERPRLWDSQAAVMPGFNDYQQKTARRIPVVVLEPTS
jgi:deazaflavin-dependent oxidoreductase (nitroreductase family)